MHRDDGSRRHAIFKAAEVIGGDDVVRPDDGTARLVVLDSRQAQPRRWIDDRVVGADLIEPLVEHLRHHRGRAVERVLGLPVPEVLHGNAALVTRFLRHLECVGRRSQRGEKSVGGLVASCLAHLLAEYRRVFQPVAVAIDDRVCELGVDLCGTQVLTHGLLRGGGGGTLDKARERVGLPQGRVKPPPSPSVRGALVQDRAGRSGAMCGAGRRWISADAIGH